MQPYYERQLEPACDKDDEEEMETDDHEQED